MLDYVKAHSTGRAGRMACVGQTQHGMTFGCALVELIHVSLAAISKPVRGLTPYFLNSQSFQMRSGEKIFINKKIYIFGILFSGGLSSISVCLKCSTRMNTTMQENI